MRGHTFRPFGGDHVGGHARATTPRTTRAGSPTRSSSTFRRWRQPSIASAARFSPTSVRTTLRAAIQLSRARGARRRRRFRSRCRCAAPAATAAAAASRGPSRARAAHGSGIELLRHQLQVTVPAGCRDGARFRFTVTPRHNPPTRIELHVVVAADRLVPSRSCRGTPRRPARHPRQRCGARWPCWSASRCCCWRPARWPSCSARSASASALRPA